MFKKLLITSLSLVTVSAFADIPDYYLGFQAGYSTTHKSGANTTVNDAAVLLTQHKNSGIAGRVFVGYAVTPFYAMEAGLTKYNSSSWATSIDNQTVPDTDLSLSGVDLASRFSWINTSKISLYNTLGLNYIRAHYGSYNAAFQLNKARSFLRPEIGIGGNYNITDASQINVNYNYIVGKGHLTSAVNRQKSGDYLPTISVVELGWIYNF